jgi:flavin reductase (DIM6/NTAB) family NADH-FMN oxidoreductase RutF
MGRTTASGALFTEAMSLLVAGVAIVTSSRDGEPCGMVVSSLRSYTAHPPSVLLCVDRTTRTHAVLIGCRDFGVHLLRRDQAALASSFATPGACRFDGVAWSWDGEVPSLPDALAYLRCTRRAVFSHADHAIVIGEVAGGRVAAPCDAGDPAPEPLVYMRRRLDWRLEPDPATAPAPASPGRRSARRFSGP